MKIQSITTIKTTSIAVLSLIGCHLPSSLAIGPTDPPPNDNFASAEVLPSQRSVSVDGTTSHTTLEPGDPGSGSSRGTVWYSWTAPASGRVKISAVSNGFHAAGVYIGDNLLSAQYIADAEITDSSPLKFYAIQGTTYRVCIRSGGNVSRGPFTLALSEDQSLEPTKTKYQEPLVNDDFDTPLVLGNQKISFVQYVALATFEPFETEMLAFVRARYNSSRRGGVWVQWTAPVTGRAYFSAKTISGEAVILIIGKGDSIAELKLLAANYNALSFHCRQGKAYRLYLLSQDDSQVVAKINAVAGVQ